MPYSATRRKTRQQKIQASQRQVRPVMAAVAPQPAVEQALPGETYNYVAQDLRKIGWITVLCLVILAVATLFLSDISMVAHWRSVLHLPALPF